MTVLPSRRDWNKISPSAVLPWSSGKTRLPFQSKSKSTVPSKNTTISMNPKTNVPVSKTVRKRTSVEHICLSAKKCAGSASIVTRIVMISSHAVTTAASWIGHPLSAMAVAKGVAVVWIKPITGPLPPTGSTEPYWLNQELVSTSPRKV